MAMDARKLLGRRIKELRQRRGFTQEQLAEIININPKYLSSIERGEENPTLELFLRLAKGLKVELYEIFEFTQEAEQPAQLRRKLERLITEISEEELVRVVRILEAMIH
jgi:transcriptional regulator with XRE-family HTH domain